MASAANPVSWGTDPSCQCEVAGNTWAVNFFPDNSMDDYALSPIDFFETGQFNLNGSGQTMVNTTVGDYVSTIAHPVTWTVHAADLRLQPADALSAVTLSATDAIFAFQGVTNDNGNFAGYLGTYGNASFTRCQFVPSRNSNWVGYSIDVNGQGTWANNTGTGDCNYDASTYPSPEIHTATFTSCYATCGIDICGVLGQSPIVSPPAVTINKGLFKYVGINIGNTWTLVPGVAEAAPWWPISITNATFDQMNDVGIYADFLNAPPPA
ncbi:MAG: hypothetical protein ACREBW_03385, partial [Candidatus Micrarchaeaceae archaeon]